MEIVLIIVLFFTITLITTAATATRSESQLHDWAQTNHFRILRSEHRLFCKGPFFFNRRNQTVHFVIIRDRFHRTRSAYIRLTRSLFFGNQTEVRWK